MFNFLLDEEESGIADPLKEDGDIFPQPKARNPHNYPADTDVNINVDTTQDQKGDVDVSFTNRDPNRIYEMSAYLNQCLPSRFLTIDSNAYYFAGQEDISGFVKNTFSSIINTLGHITNLFKTAVFHGWRDFKRSELREYVDSNVATVHRLRSVDFVTVRNMNLDVPNGMKTSYIKAFTSLTNCLKEMDMLTRSKAMCKAAERVLSSIREGNTAFSAAVNDANRDYANTKNVERLYFETEKHFTTQTSIRKATFEKCYNSVPEFSNLIDAVLDAETELQAVAAINDNLKSLESTIETIADHSNINDMSRPAIDTLSKIVRAWAFLFEKYSVVVNDVYRVNHNVTLNLEDIRKQVNY